MSNSSSELIDLCLPAGASSAASVERGFLTALCVAPDCISRSNVDSLISTRLTSTWVIGAGTDRGAICCVGCRVRSCSAFDPPAFTSGAGADMGAKPDGRTVAGDVSGEPSAGAPPVEPLHQVPLVAPIGRARRVTRKTIAARPASSTRTKP